jgi:hypothetical protein
MLGPPSETQGNKYLMGVYINNYNQTMKKRPVQISSLLSFSPATTGSTKMCTPLFDP